MDLLTFSSAFIVLMPLNTTFDQNNSNGKTYFPIWSSKANIFVVACHFAASSDRSVMILIPLESVESQFANRYLVCADLQIICNKGIYTRVLC